MSFHRPIITYISPALIFICVLLASALHAQPPGKGKKEEDIKTLKIAFITKKLDLTPEEAQKFWPVYNEFEKKMEEIRKKRREDLRSAKDNFEGMTDKEVEAIIDNEVSFRQKELDIQKEYHSKFKSVLPVKKVAKLYIAEEQFKQKLFEMLKERQKPPGKGK